MKKNIFIGLIIIGLIFLFEGKIFAHGVGYKQSNFNAIPLEFFYSTGEKMSYCEAKVFSPKDSKFAAQTGRTDEEGRFAFIPDCLGEWRITVRDEEGHQCEAKINIDNLSVNEFTPKNGDLIQGFEMFIRALLGVSLIFNLALIIKIRKRNQNAH